MTSETLIKVNEIADEIKELEYFIWRAESVWAGKIVKQDTKYIFKTKSHGAMDSVEFNMNTEIKNEVLNVLKNYLQDLKNQLNNF